MEPAVRARAGARDAVAEVTPDRLREVIYDVLEDGATTPGAVAVLAARTVDGDHPAVVDPRAAGVQLIYEGLALTRTLAREEPWTRGGDHLESDLAILAADVMVSQGFHLLARTEAAEKAVETVRSFGRDQTIQRTTDGQETYALEADVFELAVVAGATAAGAEPPAVLREYAIELAHSLNGAPTPEVPAELPEQVGEAFARLTTSRESPVAGEPVRSWATDP